MVAIAETPVNTLLNSASPSLVTVAQRGQACSKHLEQELYDLGRAHTNEHPTSRADLLALSLIHI